MRPAASASVSVGHHRVAGAGDVGDLVASRRSGCARSAGPGSNSAMPRLPRVTSTACMPRAPQHASRPARSSTSQVVVDADAEHLLDLRLVRRARRQAAVVEQRVARVDQHRHAAGAAAACRRSAHALRRAPASRARSRSRRSARRRRPASAATRLLGERAATARRAVDRPDSRSMRTTCCLAEWTPPARMRVLTGVR